MKTFQILIFLFATLFVSAQNETNHWYFGNKAALEFNLGTSLTINSNSEMNTPAGSSSISDKEGNLLFYTNGETIWNKNHQIMENGEGLLGNKNHTQSSIIIPKPKSEEIFYVFTVRKVTTEDDSTTMSGVRFSEIEISAEFPLGKIINKNIFLRNTTSERITAIHHKDDTAIWVITNGKNQSTDDKELFLVYKVDVSGVNASPISSSLTDTNSSVGQMKVSPDGKRIVMADTNGSFLHIYTFNTTTGKVGEDTAVKLVTSFTDGYSPYGIAFSQNSKVLYVSTTKYGRNGFSYCLLQQDLTIDFNPFLDPPIGKVIYKTNSFFPGLLQLGSNGNIYAAYKGKIPTRQTGLGEIINPEIIITDDNYSPEPTRLAPGASEQGLPNFIQSYFATRVLTENRCVTENFDFSATPASLITSVNWDFGDGNTATGIDVNHKFRNAGNFTVKATITIKNEEVIVNKEITVFSLPNLSPSQELVECDEDFDGLSTFNLNSIRNKITNPNLEEKLHFYLNINDLNSDTKITNSENFKNTLENQEIIVKAINSNGCSSISSFKLVAKYVALDNIADFYVCEDSDEISGNNLGKFDTDIFETTIRSNLSIPNSTILSFHETFLDAQTNLNRLDKEFISKSKTIYLKAQEADLSCGGIQSFKIIVNSEPIINIQDSYTICFKPSNKPPINIAGDSSNNRFEWKNDQEEILSINREFTLNTIGDYSLTVYKTENGIECFNKKEFSVVNPEKPTFILVDANTEDEANNMINVTVNGNSSYEFSLDNNVFFGNGSSYVFTNVAAGLRTVYVRDLDNCEEPIEADITVIGFKAFFTPNGDGDNDYWNIRGIDGESFKSINIKIFDRYGKVMGSITRLNSKGWDGTYEGKNAIENSYWFKSQIIDNFNNVIENSGNFSLIRN